MQKIRIGVLGADRSLEIIHFLEKYSSAELAAVCDPSHTAPEKVKAAADDHGMTVGYFEDIDAFLEYDMDAVVLASYAPDCTELALRCLEKGLHVLSESMTVSSLQEAAELADTAERTGQVFSYGGKTCYSRTVLEMKQRYQNGDIGELTHAEGEYIRREAPYPPASDRSAPDRRPGCGFGPAFFVSDAFGPIVNITGLRPVRIVGFENLSGESGSVSEPDDPRIGLVLMQMENNATVKVLNGSLKREARYSWTCLYGTKGCMETDRWGQDRHSLINVYTEGPQHCRGTFECYEPVIPVEATISRDTRMDFDSGCLSVRYFLERILGREDGKRSIGVYHALDILLPGLLARQSVLSRSRPVDYIDMRDPETRAFYRGGH